METYKCPVCGNNDIHSIGYLNGKPYCRKCITFRGQEVMGNYIQSEESEYTPSKSKRRDLGSRPLEGIKINKEDKPLLSL